MVESSSLPPEFKTAISYIFNKLTTDNIPKYSNVPSNIIYNNTMVIIDKKFSNRTIPYYEGWIWNQSNTTKYFTFTDYQMQFKIQKLLPRKTAIHVSLGLETPKYKMWKVQVTKGNEKPFWILWCEKGLLQGEHLGYSLSEYDFLAPFMEDKQMANELWPNKNI